MEPRVGMHVQIMDLGSTTGAPIFGKQLEARKSGVTGRIMSYMLGQTDVWFVKHDGSDDVAAYLTPEMEEVFLTGPCLGGAVTVARHSADRFSAILTENKGCVGFGRTPEEAIGTLLLTYPHAKYDMWVSVADINVSTRQGIDGEVVEEIRVDLPPIIPEGGQMGHVRFDLQFPNEVTINSNVRSWGSIPVYGRPNLRTLRNALLAISRQIGLD